MQNDGKANVEVVPNLTLKWFFIIQGAISMITVMFSFASEFSKGSYFNATWSVLASLAWFIFIRDLYYSHVVRMVPINTDAKDKDTSK